SEEHTSELQSHLNLVCRLLLEKKIRSEEHTSELQSHLNLVWRLLLEKKNAERRLPPCTGQMPDKRDDAALSAAQRQTRALRGWLFFNDTATTEIYTLSLHGALPI